MAVYWVRGFGPGPVGAGVNEVVFQLWNPSATRWIKVVELSLFWADTDVAGYTSYLVLTTARGTPGSTVTPDADNSGYADSSPPSGALLDLSRFTVQPTLASPPLLPAAMVAGGEGSGFLLPFPRGYMLKPGTGIAVAQRAATAMNNNFEASASFED